MKTSIFVAAILISAGFAASAYAGTGGNAGEKAWQNLQDREACQSLTRQFNEAVPVSHSSKAAIDHAESLAAAGADDCRIGHYQVGREALDKALIAIGATPAPSWDDNVD